MISEEEQAMSGARMDEEYNHEDISEDSGEQEQNYGEETRQEEEEEEEDNSRVIELDIPEDRPRYGNLIVLFEKGPIMISIGPDYCCFIPGFLFFAGLAYLLCASITANFTNPKVIMFTYGISLVQVGSYLLVALSNPSIPLRENNPIKVVTEKNQFRVCQICGAESKRKTYHCRSCDVCIDGYDHHCPWISKCVGKGNLYFFYLFAGLTPIYIICFIFLIMSSVVVAQVEAAEKMFPRHNITNNSTLI